jgi:hypothetical protein
MAGVVLVVIVWLLDLQLPVQLVSIITKVVSLNPVHGEVYSMQHCMIKFIYIASVINIQYFLRHNKYI